jgi:hypothetical protein
MSITLGQVITATRDRHPAFHRSRVPDAVLARFASDYQNQLIGRALERDKLYLKQSVAIRLAFDDSSDPGTAGAGTEGGLPGQEATSGAISVAEESAGSLVEVVLPADGGSVIVAERPVTSATANTVTSNGAGRSTNEDADRLIRITAGTGFGQIREIQSNSATQWVLTANWETIPDATSLLEVIPAALSVDESFGVVTELPALSTQTGYLVRLNAQGVPYIDYTAPLNVAVDRGVGLPSMIAPVGGTVRFTGTDADELTITTYGRRFDPPGDYSVYIAGQELFLCGSQCDWADVVSIELLYAPIAPDFTRLTDYFLVPDAARPALIGALAAFAASRINGVEEIAVDVDAFDAKAIDAEEKYLKTLRLAKRGRTNTFREGVY